MTTTRSQKFQTEAAVSAKRWGNSMAHRHQLLALLGTAVMLNGYAAPREVDVRETIALCRDPVVHYPTEAYRTHAEGRVVVYTVVDKGGNVSEAKLSKSSGNTALDDAAIQTTWTIKCSPFRDPESGAITSVHFLKPFVFRVVD
ncbi:energy transducer TonB [Ralstonia solanacearum]|uniref:Energy transducer TonB n=1 Tax=Ralstonia solanacearum TaxID=305 RepID=A0AAW5ZLX0_RALSL|nr:TonB family protein [Ralstonia solanacearum]MDB0570739.1 energy transducer TonB [Ralstonia solanacearum]